MSIIIPKIAKAMQTILTTNADKRAEDIGLIKRQRQFSGSTFVQTLVLGWLNKPDATLSDLTQTAADLGVTVSPQGLDKRFTYQAAEFLKLILEDTVGTLISADPVSIPILQRFHGVYIKDSSIVTLPDELHDTWQGCGGRVMKNTEASVKIHLRIKLTLKEAFVLKRIRWQIELIFKLWKDQGSIDEWRTENPVRILCEFYAKLTAMIIQHWITLSGCWHLPDRSMHKAAKVIRDYAKHLAISFATGSLKRLCEALSIIQNRLAIACRMNSRRKNPNTYQLLLQCNDGP